MDEKLDVKWNWQIFFAVITINLLGFVTGIAYAWTSPVLPKLNQIEDNPIGYILNPMEQSLLTSLLSLSAILIPFIGGLLIDQIGRKTTLAYLAIPMFLSFVITAFAKNIYFYYLARLLLGLGVGAVYALVPIYVGEITEDKNRGFYGCFLSFAYTMGSLWCFIIGPYTTISTLSLLSLIPLIIFFCLYRYLPESPYYYLIKNDEIRAGCNLKKLRTQSIDKELIEMVSLVDSNRTKNGTKWLELYRNPRARHTLMISLGLMCSQQFTGATVILSYMQTIFEAAQIGVLPPQYSTILAGFVQFSSNLITCFIIDKIGRKSLLLISIIGMCFGHVGLGTFFLFKFKYTWLPIMSMIILMIAYYIGLGPVSWLILGELFAPELKGISMACSISICFLLAFLTSFIYPYMILWFDLGITFYIFALFSLCGTLFVSFYIPETKGKSLLEIQLMLDDC